MITKAELQDRVTKLEAELDVWRTLATLNDEELAARLESIQKATTREYASLLPNPLPTERFAIAHLLCSISGRQMD
jgi:hypothetical protein